MGEIVHFQRTPAFLSSIKMTKAMKAMKAMAAMKAMRAMKKKAVSKIAKGKNCRAVVFRGTKEKTYTGLTKGDLMKNNYIKGWSTAVKQARKALGLKGFVAIKKGSAL